MRVLQRSNRVPATNAMELQTPPSRAALSFVAQPTKFDTLATTSASGPLCPSGYIVTLSISVDSTRKSAPAR